MLLLTCIPGLFLTCLIFPLCFPSNFSFFFPTHIHLMLFPTCFRAFPPLFCLHTPQPPHTPHTPSPLLSTSLSTYSIFFPSNKTNCQEKKNQRKKILCDNWFLFPHLCGAQEHRHDEPAMKRSGVRSFGMGGRTLFAVLTDTIDYLRAIKARPQCSGRAAAAAAGASSSSSSSSSSAAAAAGGGGGGLRIDSESLREGMRSSRSLILIEVAMPGNRALIAP